LVSCFDFLYSLDYFFDSLFDLAEGNNENPKESEKDERMKECQDERLKG